MIDTRAQRKSLAQNRGEQKRSLARYVALHTCTPRRWPIVQGVSIWKKSKLKMLKQHTAALICTGCEVLAVVFSECNLFPQLLVWYTSDWGGHGHAAEIFVLEWRVLRPLFRCLCLRRMGPPRMQRYVNECVLSTTMRPASSEPGAKARHREGMPQDRKTQARIYQLVAVQGWSIRSHTHMI